ncbi:MAG: transketolase [Deltaproteobacteria bacterium]|nr:transketolase [Deltaproteobacteria bacterium]
MRNTFVDQLCKEAKKNKKIWLLTADLGFSALEPFMRAFPGRYINVGVAEQNMIGIAAGLSLSGYKVFVYSIANFPTLRCLEQIRNDICYHKLDVTVVSVGAGFSYGTQGYTHHGLEDVAVMRCLPHMNLIVPADPLETRAAVSLLCTHNGPAYLRLGKAGEKNLHTKKPPMKWGKAIKVTTGRDVLILASGSLLGEAQKAHDLAKDQGISVAVWSLPFIKPLDKKTITLAMKTFKLIVTLEESQIDGAMGSAIAELIAEQRGTKPLLRRMGVPNTILYNAYEQNDARKKCGLDARSLFIKIRGHPFFSQI